MKLAKPFLATIVATVSLSWVPAAEAARTRHYYIQAEDVT
jgi:hypothetical protein